jgi:exodeoxyribonuclease V gamma subunit
MIVHRSNRTEALVDALAEVVAVPPADPFAAEWITVQSAGMGRWLAMELARRLGVWANPAFPFPRKLIETAAAAVLGPSPAGAAVFEPAALRWAVAARLPACFGRPGFEPLRRYVGDAGGTSRLLQLSGKIAELFDQYAVYRPEMVLGWEAGAPTSDWQAALWRELVTAHGSVHAAARARALRSALADGAVPDGALPPRVSVFGISTLPPLYVELLAALARHIELHLFVLSPSREYWADIRSRRAALRSWVRHDGEASTPLEGADGHPLLASLGRVGREFQYVLESLADYADDPCDRYVDPGEGSVLSLLQSDMLALRHRGAEHGAAAPPSLAAGDESIRVHACHGPMREIEVLHDQLLWAFEHDPTLAPHDVIVMAPSIDAYAPVIDAVFGGGGRPAIPFRISDRRARSQEDVTDAFLRVLDVLDSRLPASAVVDLLGLAPVRERFGIAADALDQLRRWIAESGIRWGADAAHRAEVGQPPCADHTWRFGIDRLLLGYALPPDADELFGGVLPYGDVGGGDGDLLGRLAEFAGIIGRLRAAAASARPPAQWRVVLGEMLAGMIAATPATAYQHHRIGEALDALATAAATAGFSGPCDFATVRALIEEAIERDTAPRGFLNGAVTFCELVPMRTIPFRVVCLVGLNDGEFPRAKRAPAFDRMAQSPRAGDRTARDDDRYLFLEALLAARERLIITYVGQSISDNGILPPSVVVDELLDAIDRSVVLPDGGSPRTRVVRRHPLQPFSPDYFGADPGRGLVSYAAGHCAGAIALTGPPTAPAPLVSAALPDEGGEVVALDDLVRFFENPTRWFLQRRLGVYLGHDAAPLEDREPIDLDQLGKWRIGDALLARMMRDGGAEPAWERIRAQGLLPLGTPGRRMFDEIAPCATALAAVAAARRGGDRLDPHAIDVALDDGRLVGVLRDLFPHGQVFVQYSRLSGRRELSAWIRHLAACAGVAPVHTVLIGRGDAQDAAQVRFRPVDDARRLLADLVRFYRAGQIAPLPFLASASHACASEPLDAPAERVLQEAEKAFGKKFGNDRGDAYVDELYRGVPPWAGGVESVAARRFIAVARAVYGPLFASREDTP